MTKSICMFALLAMILSATSYATAFAQATMSRTHPQAMMNSGARADQPSDSTLSNEVKHALASDPATQSGNIQVRPKIGW
jgi:hypothetical protein